jgi:hypothetical protein
MSSEHEGVLAMTGAEFKKLVAVSAALTVLLLLLPSLLVAMLRRFTACAPGDSGEGFAWAALAFLGSVALLYAVVVYKIWDFAMSYFLSSSERSGCSGSTFSKANAAYSSLGSEPRASAIP